MSIEISTQKELENFLIDALDNVFWELSEPPSPDESLDLITEFTGLIGIPDDDSDEIKCLSIELLEPLTIEEFPKILLEDHEQEAYTRLKETLSSLLPISIITPVKFTQGIALAADLIRTCFRIDIKHCDKTITCYLRDATYGDTFIERYAGPMWEGHN